jgi:uracil-DNA glycosylase family 4
VDGGRFDADRIGPWSLWQGNLSATLMVVGQDWGDVASFRKQGGREGAGSPTNRALVELIAVAGISIGAPGSTAGRDMAFFTNAILCLKESGLQAEVQPEWFANCAPFLRRQIEIVNPAVVVGLGAKAYEAILAGFGMKSGAFRSEVESSTGTLLPNASRAFAVYHCGKRIQNTHRPIQAQRRDWSRIRPFLTRQ